MPEVLFLCTGNTCRSPIAEVILREELARRNAGDDWVVSSAGMNAEEGEPAPSASIQAMEERGYDLRDHRSRALKRAQVQATDLFLVMTQAHKERFQAEFQADASKVFLLSEMVGQDNDVRDPYGGTLSQYREVAAQIADIIQDGYNTIVAKARAGSGKEDFK